MRQKRRICVLNQKGYPLRNLFVVTEKESRRFDDLRDDSCMEAVKFIKIGKRSRTFGIDEGKKAICPDKNRRLYQC